jgi:Spy/CpxP family protein refolding chaperone
VSRLGWVALILSLAMNSGVLAVVGVNAYRDWSEQREYAQWWRDGRASAARVRRMFSDYHEAKMAIGRRFPEARKRLGRLGLAEMSDSIEVERVLDSLSGRSRAFDSLMTNLMLRMMAERRPDLVEKWRENGPFKRDSLRQYFESLCARVRQRR